MPNNGGSWVEKNKDAHEQWNFLNQNGYCYGFVMNKGEQFAIERIDKDYSKAAVIDDVTVVWCALKPNNETVIVGWYEHATVCRNFQDSIVTPFSGIDRMYFCRAKAEDCYLLPETSRTFKIDRASQAGKGKGFGQQNYWYAESAYARSELIPEVKKYLEEHRHERINLLSTDFEAPQNVLSELSKSEAALATELFSAGNFFEFLPYGYRNFYASPTADNAYDIAEALSALYQYDTSLSWYQKVIDIEGETWNNLSYMPYLYQQCGKHDKALSTALNLLKYSEAKEDEVKHELYGIIADSYYYLNNITEAISWLEKVLAESNNEDLIKHTVSTKEIWRQLL
jgi:tetratricopeptide (TPR) repeat protein